MESWSHGLSKDLTSMDAFNVPFHANLNKIASVNLLSFSRPYFPYNRAIFKVNVWRYFCILSTVSTQISFTKKTFFSKLLREKHIVKISKIENFQVAETDGDRELLAEKGSAAWQEAEAVALAENVMAKAVTAVATPEAIAEVEVAVR